MRRTLKVKSHTPAFLINKLVLGKGYHVAKREPNKYILLAKLSSAGPSKPIAHTIIDTIAAEKGSAVMEGPISRSQPWESIGPLSVMQENELIMRCDRIVDFFPEPYSVIGSVRTRLHNMMQTLPSIEERQFVLEFIDENFPLEGK